VQAIKNEKAVFKAIQRHEISFLAPITERSSWDSAICSDEMHYLLPVTCKHAYLFLPSFTA